MNALRGWGTTSMRTAVALTLGGLASLLLLLWAWLMPGPTGWARVVFFVGITVGAVLVVANGASWVHLLRHPQCRTPPLTHSPRMSMVRRWFTAGLITVVFIPSTSAFAHDRHRPGLIILVCLGAVVAAVSAALWVQDNRRARSRQQTPAGPYPVQEVGR